LYFEKGNFGGKKIYFAKKSFKLKKKQSWNKISISVSRFLGPAMFKNNPRSLLIARYYGKKP
jgi:hypothetical protein